MTTLVRVLTVLLSSDYQAAAWQGWVEGPSTADATCQIRHDQIDFTQLDKLEASDHVVLLSMHKHKAFEAEAWECMQGVYATVKRLAPQLAEAVASGRCPFAGITLSQLPSILQRSCVVFRIAVCCSTKYVPCWQPWPSSGSAQGYTLQSHPANDKQKVVVSAAVETPCTCADADGEDEYADGGWASDEAGDDEHGMSMSMSRVDIWCASWSLLESLQAVPELAFVTDTHLQQLLLLACTKKHNAHSAHALA